MRVREKRPGVDVAADEPSPGADVAAERMVRLLTWTMPMSVETLPNPHTYTLLCSVDIATSITQSFLIDFRLICTDI